MNDKSKIMFGVAIFLLLMTFPIWYNLARGTKTRGKMPGANIVRPAAGECVMDTKYMRASHMDLLNRWRDDYVRGMEKGDVTKQIHVTKDNRRYVKSLSNTCLSAGCHVNKDEFCTRCHNYAGVDPYCWDCHVIPKNPNRR